MLSFDSDVPVILNTTRSDWWEAISFTIIQADGRQFQVTRPALNRLNNYSEKWILGKGRCRVFVVNLKTGDWRGLPTLSDLPDRKPLKLQAFFRLRGMKSDVRAKSEPVELRS